MESVFCLGIEQGGASGKEKRTAPTFCSFGQGVKNIILPLLCRTRYCWKLKLAVWNYSATNIYSDCGVAWKKLLRKRQPAEESIKILSRQCIDEAAHIHLITIWKKDQPPQQGEKCSLKQYHDVI